MKLCLVKVGKSDACIRPLFANSVTYTRLAELHTVTHWAINGDATKTSYASCNCIGCDHHYNVSIAIVL